MEENDLGALFGSFGVILVVVLLCGGLYGCPQYNVYSSEMSGEAELAQAKYSKQVAVQSAQAKLDSSDLLAKADVRRAEGVAAANKILQDQLGGPDNYLRWKYIEMLEETAGQAGRTTIYIPTEGLMPILEAGRAAKEEK